MIVSRDFAQVVLREAMRRFLHGLAGTATIG